MPEFTVKEVRLPELRLPEIKRDEIARALSGIHLPEVDPARVEPRRRQLGVILGSLPTRSRGMAGFDAGKVVAAAIATARIIRPASSRSRWSPFRTSRWRAVSRSRDNLVAVVRPARRRSRRRIAVVVIALVAAAAWTLFRNPAVRSRLDRAASDARRRIASFRAQANTDGDVELVTGEPPVTASGIAPSDATAIAAIEVTEPGAA